MENRIKVAYTCAQVAYHHIDKSMSLAHLPQPGDVAVCRVLEANGDYLKDAEGGSHYLFTGDLILVAFGHRYATNQFEGYVPATPTLTLDLIARGGVVGVVHSKNHTFKGEAIPLELVGYAVDQQGQVVNTIQWDLLRPFDPTAVTSKVILSIGSSMDSGKTTSAAYLCAGLRQAGYRAAYLKLTGTAFPKDTRYVLDRGAEMVGNFHDFGFTSTYLLGTDTLLDLYTSLLTRIQDACQPDYVVVEIADGLLQQETRQLLQHQSFMRTVHGVLLSCGDSLGVLSGLSILAQWGIQPFAVSGLFTASELLVREVASDLNVPVLGLAQLLEINPLLLIESPRLVTGIKAKVRA